ncbi:MAG: hypothetical protein KDI06_06450 [Calditrichaeota bacterium]|nr:hypothetical protein [Calditrichota bacterium]
MQDFVGFLPPEQRFAIQAAVSFETQQQFSIFAEVQGFGKVAIDEHGRKSTFRLRSQKRQMFGEETVIVKKRGKIGTNPNNIYPAGQALFIGRKNITRHQDKGSTLRGGAIRRGVLPNARGQVRRKKMIGAQDLIYLAEAFQGHVPQTATHGIAYQKCPAQNCGCHGYAEENQEVQAPVIAQVLDQKIIPD